MIVSSRFLAILKLQNCVKLLLVYLIYRFIYAVVHCLNEEASAFAFLVLPPISINPHSFISTESHYSWELPINPNITEDILISHNLKTPPFILKINNVVIPWSSLFKNFTIILYSCTWIEGLSFVLAFYN